MCTHDCFDNTLMNPIETTSSKLQSVCYCYFLCHSYIRSVAERFEYKTGTHWQNLKAIPCVCPFSPENGERH